MRRASLICFFALFPLLLPGNQAILCAAQSLLSSENKPALSKSETVDEKSPRQSIRDIAVARHTLKDRAWNILRTGCAGKNAGDRADAVHALGLLRNDASAVALAKTALSDENADVRAAAAQALGQLRATVSVPDLTRATSDSDPIVALSAAHSLEQMNEPAAFDVYYEVLTGERRATRGVFASEAAKLRDPKKWAQLGVKQGLGFVPYGNIGWTAYKTMSKDDATLARAAAARVLAKDPDPEATRALVEASGDNDWLVRAASLEGLALRGDPSATRAAEPFLSDDHAAVRFAAAATILRLSSVRGSVRTSTKASSQSRKTTRNR